MIGTIIIALFLSACGNKSLNEKSLQEKEQENTQDTTINQTNDTDQELFFSSHDFFEDFDGKLDHIHGLGYAGNQNAIFFAAHDGLKVYENGKWFKTKKENNDYMGFNAVDKGFYTSGHPGRDSNLPNPLGLKRSLDFGQTLENLGLEGESDFHAMGVGYENHTVYVFNEHKNSKMGTGLYVTRDNGNTWAKIQAKNLGEDIFSIAVHPKKDELVAVAGKDGVFLSKDGGENFGKLNDKQGTSVFFSENALWYGAYDKEPVLVKYVLETKEKVELSLPKLEKDAVMYLAQNPQNQSEIVFSTFNGHVFLSKDYAKTWDQLVKKGKIQ